MSHACSARDFKYILNRNSANSAEFRFTIQNHSEFPVRYLILCVLGTGSLRSSPLDRRGSVGERTDCEGTKALPVMDILDVVLGEDSSSDLAVLENEDSDAVATVVLPEHQLLGRLLSAAQNPSVRSSGDQQVSTLTEHRACPMSAHTGAAAAAKEEEDKEEEEEEEEVDTGTSSASCTYRAVQLLIWVAAFNIAATFPWVYARRANMPEPNTLLYVSGAFNGAGFASGLLLLDSARCALQPGGALEQLGAGFVHVSAREATNLARWTTVMRTLCIIGSLLFLYLGWGVYLPAADLGVKNSVAAVFNPTFMALLGWPLMFTWMSSFSLGSCVCRDAATEVLVAAKTTDPTSKPTWDARVARPALALHQKLRILSAGWARGLAGLTLALWFLSAAMLTWALNDTHCAALDTARGSAPGTAQGIYFAELLLTISLPLLLALDVAGAPQMA
eukprot:SAG11_NODE_86_length_17300_cov_11.466717_12_plen_448_part_00